MNILELSRKSGLFKAASKKELLRKAVTIAERSPQGAKVLPARGNVLAGPPLPVDDLLGATVIRKAPTQQLKMSPQRLRQSDRMLVEPALPSTTIGKSPSLPKAPTPAPQAPAQPPPLPQRAAPTPTQAPAPTPAQQSVLLRKKKEIAAGTALGTGGVYGGSSLADPQKTGSLVGMALRGAGSLVRHGTKGAVKATLGGKWRRRATGTALLTGGMAAHGASQGAKASYGVPLRPPRRF